MAAACAIAQRVLGVTVRPVPAGRIRARPGRRETGGVRRAVRVAEVVEIDGGVDEVEEAALGPPMAAATDREHGFALDVPFR